MNQTMRRILLLIIPILGFIGLLKLGLPEPVTNFFNAQSLIFFIFTLVLLRLSLIFKKEGFIFKFAIILFLFSINLSYYWHSVTTIASLIGGLIPHRDSMYYYLGARSIMSGGLLGFIIGGRPLFSGFLSAINWFAKDNIQTILIVLACLNAFAITSLFEKARKYFSENATSFFIAMVILFYSRFLPHMVSEQLGILLSTLSLIFLLEGIFAKNNAHWMVGLFLLALSLNARAGAMFILPLFIPFTFFLFFKNKNRWKLLIYATLIMISAFVLNSIVTKLIVDPSVMPYSSFANALYGQSKGGAGWTSIQKDFPGIVDGKEIMQLALANIQRYPLGLLLGSAKAVRDFLGFGIDSAFTTLIYNRSAPVLTVSAWLLIWGLVSIALINAVRNFKKPFNIFLILIFIGILISTPFAPPIDSGAMRTYAATIPLLYLLPTQGIELLNKKIMRLLKKKEINQEITNDQMHPLIISLSALLVLAICLGPVVNHFIHPPENQLLTTSQDCNPDDIQERFKLNYGSYILISPPGENHCGMAPVECRQDFLKRGSGATNETFGLVSQWISGQNEEVVFAAVDGMSSGNYYQVMIKGSELPQGFPSEAPIYSCLKLIDKREFLYEAYHLSY